MLITRLTLSAPPGRTHMAELQIITHERRAELQIYFPGYWYLAWTLKYFMYVGKNWRLMISNYNWCYNRNYFATHNTSRVLERICSVLTPNTSEELSHPAETRLLCQEKIIFLV